MSIFTSVTLVCEKDSWLLPYVVSLQNKLLEQDIGAKLVHDYTSIQYGEAAFFLGCTKVCPKELLSRSQYNLVVHESELPKGRGFAPISWTVLSGSNVIIFSLIEADVRVDSGKIYNQLKVRLKGTELCAEIRDLQGKSTTELCLDFILTGRMRDAKEQEGESTYLRRRTPADSELDVNKTLAEQFNLLRIVDNERYPAFFKHKGRIYRLKIDAMDDINNV
jgi:methionyl-tRNA formyltransferase